MNTHKRLNLLSSQSIKSPFGAKPANRFRGTRPGLDDERLHVPLLFIVFKKLIKIRSSCMKKTGRPVPPSPLTMPLITADS